MLDLEEKRLDLQSRLATIKTQTERNRMGQFATPTGLAMEILRFARHLLPKRTVIQFLDPAFGTGSFYSALLKAFPSGRLKSAMGFEIDPLYAEPAAHLWRDTELQLCVRDFTQEESPKREKDQFNLIICNPPYVRHHHINNGDKARLQEKLRAIVGTRISGLAGLYCYFLLMSRSWMKKRALAAWLIPSEFMDVNYGKAIKQFLLTEVTLEQIHRYDPNDVQFGDALVSSAIVWFWNTPPPVNHTVKFTYGRSMTKPHISKNVPVEILHTEPKWTRFPVHGSRSNRSRITLGDLFATKRGLATGDNSFFILTREQIKARKLPHKCFRPILPSPRYLREGEITSDKKGVPSIERQLFLLDCSLTEDEIKDSHSELWTYLEEGKQNGVADRYLCRHRDPWYCQENRPPPLFLCTYFGRSDKKERRPFRFILNHSKATATNSYLLLYPKPQLAEVIDRTPQLAHEIWKLLKQIPRASLLEEGRVYGGGLHKLEPRELANVPLDTLPSSILLDTCRK